jgi:hypothetical protein
MSRQNLSTLLLAAAIVLLLAALATLTPWDSKTVSDLGYHTLCPFAPWSTLTLLFFAWVGWAVRKHVNSQQT